MQSFSIFCVKLKYAYPAVWRVFLGYLTFHSVMLILAIVYLVYMISGGVNDPGGGLQFIGILFMGMPMLCLALGFYLICSILFLSSYYRDKAKLQDTGLQCQLESAPTAGRYKLIFWCALLSLIVDIFYVLGVFCPAVWALWILTHMVT